MIGQGAIVVEVDDVEGFAEGLITLLDDEKLRHEMGRTAYHHTVPYFTWSNRVATFIDEVGQTN
jgi:glycosyltransferase involved in cell wall biosynthesis